MSDLGTTTSLPDRPPIDNVDRRVKSQVYTGIARAYLGYIPVNREWENCCEGCRGDGCSECGGTGEKA